MGIDDDDDDDESTEGSVVNGGDPSSGTGSVTGTTPTLVGVGPPPDPSDPCELEDLMFDGVIVVCKSSSVGVMDGTIVLSGENPPLPSTRKRNLVPLCPAISFPSTFAVAPLVKPKDITSTIPINILLLIGVFVSIRTLTTLFSW